MSWSAEANASGNVGARATEGSASQPAVIPDGGGSGSAGPLDLGEYQELLASADALLDAVDRALVQLADGAYGICTECGEPIDDVVLGDDPTAQRCGRHGSID